MNQPCSQRRSRVFIIGSREPWQSAVFDALGQLADVVHLSPILCVAGWLPQFRHRFPPPLPLGAHTHRPWLARSLAPISETRLRKAYGTADALIITEPLYWAYARHFHRLASVKAYHVSDDYAYWPASRLELERRLIDHVDLIFPVSQRLSNVLQTRYRLDPGRIHITPNGIPASWIPPSPPSAPRSLPEQIPAWFRPLIGVIGVIGSRVNLEPIAAAHDALPDLHWLFVGPIRKEVPGLRHLQNSGRCRFIGALPYTSLQPYFAAVDAAVLPLTDGDVNPSSSPVRFFSQLPTGQPILSLGRCDQLHEIPHLCSHCRDAEALIDALASLQQCRFRDGHAEARHRFATTCTWQERARVIATALRLTT